MTMHGGIITSPGAPTVLIGKMPAARMTDMHVCPMITPPAVPHVGMLCVGPVPPTVLIGKLPAACVGDMFLCAGPPATALPPGCMTVMIGMAGDGGGGGGGGSATAAASAQTLTASKPKKITGLTVEGLPVTEVTVGDNPQVKAQAQALDLKLMGDCKPQDAQEREGVGMIKFATWKVERCWFGEEVTLTITTKNYTSGAKLKLQLWERDETNPDDFIKEVDVSISGDETEVKWKAEFDTKGLYEADEGDDFEVYPIVRDEERKVAASFRENLLYIDVVKPGVGI
jgi:uncharacterized Zn-binding protein involved in type VI secretion